MTGSPSQGAWDCRHGVDGRDHCEDCFKPAGRKYLYAAYGMNLDPGPMEMPWLPPEARPKALGPGVLRDWRLRFRGFADIDWNPGRDVPVAVWEIGEDALRSLDEREGLGKMYDRYEVEVELSTGPARAFVYALMDEHKNALQAPGEYYLDMLERGYDHFKIDKAPLRAAVKEAGGGEGHADGQGSPGFNSHPHGIEPSPRPAVIDGYEVREVEVGHGSRTLCPALHRGEPGVRGRTRLRHLLGHLGGSRDGLAAGARLPAGGL